MHSRLLASVFSFALTVQAAPAEIVRRSGFSGFDQLESIGDSWSRTGFNITGGQPSVSHPLGNPDYPGRTSANGPNWLGYLTTSYNQSVFLTYNFGTSGATIDSDIVDADADVLGELNDKFIPYYARNSTWDRATTLFAIWIGVNDINRSYMGDYTATNEADLEQYRAVLDTLYEIGARNFLLLNAPPLERSPAVTGFETADVRIPRCLNMTTDWNGRLENLQEDIQHDYQDANVFLLDINTLFNEVIDDPAKYNQTAVYKDTRSQCGAYNDGTPEVDTKYDECDYAANEYLWLNTLHPTSPIHELVAYKAAELLSA
ncbi:SGNH/GDSL hydrolase family protein [Aspergillus stella-maris]|uniref:SGNH/GDSL hydrolase family protein n=1 Tax=Aspergillus stella-maris TaxID=1810926 RepID=UPI003CCD4C0A